MFCRAVDAKLAELEAGRDLTRTWLHVDMCGLWVLGRQKRAQA